MQYVAFNLVNGDSVAELADVLHMGDLVCVDVDFGLGRDACCCVAWRFEMRQSKLVLEEFLPAVNR